MHILSFLMRFLRTGSADEQNELINGIIKNRSIPTEAKNSIAEAVYKVAAKEENGLVILNTQWKDITQVVMLLSCYTTLEFSTEKDGSHGEQFLKELIMLQEHKLPERLCDAIGSDCQSTIQIIDGYFRQKQLMLEQQTQKVGTWQELGFRKLYHRFVLLLDDSSAGFDVSKTMLSARSDDNAILAYGYIDRQQGLSLKSLCTVQYLDNGTVDLNEADGSMSMTIRYGSMTDKLMPISRDSRFDRFDFLIKWIHESYKAPDELEKTRRIAELDFFRHPIHPDDVQVCLRKERLQEEYVWVRLTDVHDNTLHGILLNEPRQDFGCHLQDVLEVEYNGVSSQLIVRFEEGEIMSSELTEKFSEVSNLEQSFEETDIVFDDDLDDILLLELDERTHDSDTAGHTQEPERHRSKYLCFERRVLDLGDRGFEDMNSEQEFSEVIQQSEIISRTYTKLKAPYNILCAIIGAEEISFLGEDFRAYEERVPPVLLDVLSTLTPREEKVLKVRYGIEDGQARTLEETGREFNLTRERIRQIEAKALRKLRHPSRFKKLKCCFEPTIHHSKEAYEIYISELKELIYNAIPFQPHTSGSVRELYYPLLKRYYHRSYVLQCFNNIATYLRPVSDVFPSVLNDVDISELVLPLHVQEMLYGEGISTLMDLYILFIRGKMKTLLQDTGLTAEEADDVIKQCVPLWGRKNADDFSLRLIGDFIGTTIDQLEKLCVEDKHSIISRYVPFDILEVLLDLNYRSFEDLSADYKSGDLDKRGKSPRFRALYGDTFHIVKPYIEALLKRQFDLFRVTIVNQSVLPASDLSRITDELHATKDFDWKDALKQASQQITDRNLPLSGNYAWFKIALKEIGHVDGEHFDDRYEDLIKYRFVGVRTLEKLYQGFKQLPGYQDKAESFAIEFMQQKRTLAMSLPISHQEDPFIHCKNGEGRSAEKDRIIAFLRSSPKKRIWSVTIDRLDLGHLTYSSLKRSNINSVGELIQKTREDLEDIRGIGAQECDKIESRLQRWGLSLRAEGTSERKSPPHYASVVARVLDKRIDTFWLDIDWEIGYELDRNGIVTINDLAHTTEKDLKKIRGLGPASIKRMSDQLRKLGLSLREDNSTPQLQPQPKPVIEKKKIAELTRKALYDEIWTISVAGVAKKYSIQYDQCLKQIKNANIPIPPSGYWTKLSFGKPVEKIQLEGSFDEVVVLYTHL